MIQVTSFKLTGKRVFKMAPLHHHFEKMGMGETKIVIRFWIVSVLLGGVALASLKLEVTRMASPFSASSSWSSGSARAGRRGD